MEGLHLTADCFDCLCNPRLLTEEEQLTQLTRTLTLASGLTIVGEKFHAFQHADGSAAGVTGTLLLAESHVAIHTWPERKAVTLDVYVCNFENDNSTKARQIVHELIAAFQPQHCSQQELHRGGTTTHYAEKLTPYTSMHTQVDRIIAQVQSPYQSLEIADTPEFGKVMRIDGALMTSEKDQFYYHESLVHPAAISHGQPHTALIIGGGDGGSTEELLKHHSIKSITLCEIDEQVVQLARQHLQSIHHQAFDSPKLRLRHDDGFAFIKHSTGIFDLILLDLTDPITASGSSLAQSCMSLDFFQACHARLSEQGVLVLHLGNAFYHQERYQATLVQLQSIFASVLPYSVFIPLYGAEWGMAMASKSNLHLTPEEIQARIQAQDLGQLQFYSAARHTAWLAQNQSSQKR